MKKVCFISLLLLALCELKSAPRSAVSSAPEATVEIVVHRSGGQFLDSSHASLDVMKFESSDKKNYAKKFRGGVASGIPFGDYVVEAGLSGIAPELRIVRIHQKAVTVLIGVGSYQVPDYAVSTRGRVIGVLTEPNKSLVKIIGVHSSISEESRISSAGEFELSWLRDGKYLLMVVTAEGIIASRAVEIPNSGRPLEINVEKDRRIP